MPGEAGYYYDSMMDGLLRMISVPLTSFFELKCRRQAICLSISTKSLNMAIIKPKDNFMLCTSLFDQLP
jgi:hypothetical protein